METAVSLFIGRMSHGIVLGDFCDVIVKHHAAIEFATCRAMPDDVMGYFIERLAKQRHMIGVDVFHESIVVQRDPSMEPPCRQALLEERHIVDATDQRIPRPPESCTCAA